MTGTTRQQPIIVKWTAWVSMIAILCIVLMMLLSRSKLGLANHDAISPDASKRSATLGIGVLVLREGLEWILGLAAITAGVIGDRSRNALLLLSEPVWA